MMHLMWCFFYCAFYCTVCFYCILNGSLFRPHRDGQLQEGDQILAIDEYLFDKSISNEKAIDILKNAHGIVEIIVARDSISDDNYKPLEDNIVVEGEEEDKDMVLNTEWAQVECVELVNDGTGLGFGIIGGRSTGVIVKTIVPGGVSDRVSRTLINIIG